MKRTKIKILITLVVGVVVLFLIFFMVFNKPESVPNGSASIWTYTPYIELDGNKYLFEDPLGKSNLFFEVQDNWEELEDCSVQYVNFSCEDNLAEDAIYCDISQVCTYDLYLKVSEEWSFTGIYSSAYLLPSPIKHTGGIVRMKRIAGILLLMAVTQVPLTLFW